MTEVTPHGQVLAGAKLQSNWTVVLNGSLISALELPKLSVNQTSTFRFALYYSDDMVLHQTPRRSTLWGYTALNNVGSRSRLNLRDLKVYSRNVKQSSGKVSLTFWN